MDSYNVAHDSRQLVNDVSIHFFTSVKPDRFSNEVNMVHPLGNVDKTGECKGIYNETILT